MDDLQWIMDIKSYPTLQQLFDKGEIEEGDVLVLRGEIESGTNEEITWVNDFTITVDTKGETLDTSSFDLDPNEIEAGKAMNLSDYINVTFLNSDGNLEVIRKNNKSTQLTESEDLQWIKDINPIPELKVGSCFVDVMDPAQRKWVITHFKMTPAGTRLVVVKNNDKIFVDDLSPFNSEDIKYMHEEYFEQDLFNGRYKPCQR